MHKTIAPYRVPDSNSNTNKINPKWSQEEQLLGVQGKFDEKRHLFLLLTMILQT